MEDTFQDMEDIKVYIDYIGIWAQDWKHHQNIVEETLGCLESNGFTIYPL
jgi:hypothetical protein